jgi:hypothetical protein
MSCVRVGEVLSSIKSIRGCSHSRADARSEAQRKGVVATLPASTHAPVSCVYLLPNETALLISVRDHPPISKFTPHAVYSKDAGNPFAQQPPS